MSRPALEIAEIFRDHGREWRAANAGHISLDQLKVMSAIEACRTVRLGGHVARCENAACGHTTIAYNSCRNRHCPKCQSAAARKWLADRESELLPVPYFHVVFTLPVAIAADPKHLGARIGITSVLHTWGSAMAHHPHVHMIVPGGGISLDGRHWINRKPDFFLPVRVLSRLFRRLMLTKLVAAHKAGKLAFFGDHARFAGGPAFIKSLKPLRRRKWFVYAKRPFGSSS